MAMLSIIYTFITHIAALPSYIFEIAAKKSYTIPVVLGGQQLGVLNINTFLGLFFTLFLFHEEEWWANGR